MLGFFIGLFIGANIGLLTFALLHSIKHAPMSNVIDAKDIQGWADEARDRVEADKHWGGVEDAMREMLIELGIKIK